MADAVESNRRPGDSETPDLQSLLPAEWRSRWCVLPRFALYQLFAVGVLFGTGLSLTIAGWIVGNRFMTWAWPLAILAMLFQAKLLR
ncbi:MAG: hypothetical protein ACRD2L_03650, partial [Terriglobia bacterium]